VDSGLVRELAIATVLAIYVLGVVYGVRFLYEAIRRRGSPHSVAVYYTRKAIHSLAGGVIALLVPHLFSTPEIPLLMAFLLGGFLWYHHRGDRLLWWFQTRENMYEVSFTIGWGVSLWVLWRATGDPMLAVVPALFIAFGDSVTGVVRNKLFGRRTKSWWGNLAMLPVTVCLGFAYAGLAGLVAGVIAAFVEHYEFPPLDDNILVALASMLVLLAGVSF